jgi:hypothetical protein
LNAATDAARQPDAAAAWRVAGGVLVELDALGREDFGARGGYKSPMLQPYSSTRAPCGRRWRTSFADAA